MPKQILIAYGSRCGSTAEIARAMAETFKIPRPKRGPLEAQVAPLH